MVLLLVLLLLIWKELLKCKWQCLEIQFNSMLSGITWHQLAAHKGKFGAPLVVGRLHCCVCVGGGRVRACARVRVCVKLISHFLRQSQLITLLTHLPHPITCTFTIGSHLNDFTAFMFIITPYMVISEWHNEQLFWNLSFVYCILVSDKNLHIFTLMFSVWTSVKFL